jgi:hypothetical protein
VMLIFGCPKKHPLKPASSGCPNPPIYIGAEGATVPCSAG